MIYPKALLSALGSVAYSLSIVLAALTFTTLAAPAAEAACSALPTTKGTVAMNLSVPSSGSYRVWVRMISPSTNVNGFYLQIADANACQVTMGDAVIATNAWTWIDYQNGTSTNKVNVTLTAGTHQVNLAGLDDGVIVDKVLLLSDTACTPTGDGANCTSAATGSSPTPGATPAATPTPIAVVSGSSSKPVTVKQSITIPTAGISDAKCAIDGKTVDCALVDTTKLSDGNHTVTITGTDAEGKPVSKSTTIAVKNKATMAEQIVAGVKKYQWPLLAVLVLLIAAPSLWFLNRRFGWLNRLRPGNSTLGASAGSSTTPPVTPSVTMPTPSSMVTPPTTPPAPAPSTPPAPEIVYPSDPTKTP